MEHGPLVGVFSPYISGKYYGAVISAITRVVSEVGGKVVSVQTAGSGKHYNSGEIVDDLALVGWRRLSGVITVTKAVPRSYVEQLLARKIPVVSVAHEEPGTACPAVMSDNRRAVSQVVAHLAAHGHTRIAYSGCVEQLDGQERYTAYREALAAHNLPDDPGLFFPAADNTETGGVAAAKAMMAAGVPSTAVVVGDDYNALGIVAALTEAGWRLPEAQAIVGFGGMPEAAMASPSLTSVAERLDLLGATAADLVLRQVAGLPVEQRRYSIETRLVTRESCGCGPGAAEPPPEATEPAAMTRAMLHESNRALFALRKAMRDEFEITIELLSHRSVDPRSLGWLRRTSATAAVLALWPRGGEPGPLDVAGTYLAPGPRGAVQRCLPLGNTSYPVEEFPPEELVERAGVGTVLAVFPLASDTADWGFLAIAGPVDSDFVGQESHFMWSALLAEVLDHQAVMDSLHEKTDDLARSYEREREMGRALRHQAHYDSLTGLPNRVLFLECLGKAIAGAREQPGHPFALLWLDLDNFKEVNDTLGHVAGDKLLTHVGSRITFCLRGSDMAARLGGDEFAVLVNDAESQGALVSIIRRVLEAVAAPYDLDGHQVSVTASLGVTTSDEGYELAEEVVKDADVAMYRAKALGGATWAAYSREPSSQMVSRSFLL